MTPDLQAARVIEFADRKRWAEGYHNASRLYDEIHKKGYMGKRSMAARFVSGWRATARPTAPHASESWQMEACIELTKLFKFRPLVRLAYGIQKDMAPVNAAVVTAWSNAQVAGQINRLKMIKRQMMGEFPLLRARVLPSTPAVPTTPGPLHRRYPRVRKSLESPQGAK